MANVDSQAVVKVLVSMAMEAWGKRHRWLWVGWMVDAVDRCAWAKGLESILDRG